MNFWVRILFRKFQRGETAPDIQDMEWLESYLESFKAMITYRQYFYSHS